MDWVRLCSDHVHACSCCFGRVQLFDQMDHSLPGFSVHGILQARILPGVGCHPLLKGISPTQGSNLGILHYRQILNHLSHLENQYVVCVCVCVCV